MGTLPELRTELSAHGIETSETVNCARRRGMALYAVAPKPFSMSNSGYTRNGGFSFFFGGEADQSYQIQVSDNLVDWLSVLEVNSETGLFWINDSDAVNYPVTYYRGMAQDHPTVP